MMSNRGESSIININLDVAAGPQQVKRSNKNDFYRFLLSQNHDNPEALKINNDVLIPRSILKRNNPGNLVKDRRLEEAQ
jgi:hypothetical protein